MQVRYAPQVVSGVPPTERRAVIYFAGHKGHMIINWDEPTVRRHRNQTGIPVGFFIEWRRDQERCWTAVFVSLRRPPSFFFLVGLRAAGVR